MSLGGQKVDLLPVPLALPAQRESLVQAPPDALRQELEERHLVVRLDREVAVRRLDEVPLRDPPHLGGEGRLKLRGGTCSMTELEKAMSNSPSANGSFVPSPWRTVMFDDASHSLG